MGCSLPNSSVYGVFQAGILEWVAISFSRGFSWHRGWTLVSCIAGGFFTTEPPGKPYFWLYLLLYMLLPWHTPTHIKSVCTNRYLMKVILALLSNNPAPPKLTITSFFSLAMLYTYKPMCVSVQTFLNTYCSVPWFKLANRLVSNRKRSSSRLYIVTLFI